MNLYPTYQAAKIANRESVIYKDMHGNFIPYDGGFSIPAGELCKPADYCMTVEKLLEEGGKVVDGDLILNRDGEVVEIGKVDENRLLVTAQDVNLSHPTISREIFILAKTLEEKENNPIYRYEKVTDSIENIAKAMIDGETFYSKDGSDRFDWRLNGFGKNNLALTGLNGFDFYRRIEVTDRELFIDTQEEMAHKDGYHINRLFLGWQFDNGVRLVNGKG